MTQLRNVFIQSSDSPSIDAFGRFRVSQPVTLFDSKQLHDALPDVWDDAETSGAGTSSAHDTDAAKTTISVSGTTAGTRVRQTIQRFNYQPGKSQLVFLTCGEFDTSTGITKRFGYFDGENGVFFESDAGTVSAVQRSYVSGAAVDTAVAQSSWNLDQMDGSGSSGVTLDFTKTQIAVFDFEWLGVGRVRCGWVVDGAIVYCHAFLNTNSLTDVYMSTPNLPLRYEIDNDGTGAADGFDHICSTVISEGGAEITGVTRYKSTAGTHIDANAAGTLYVIVGIRLKSTALDGVVEIEGVSLMNEASQDFEWVLLLNPTLANAVTFSAETNSVVETAVGNAGSPSNSTATGGTAIDGGFVKSSVSAGSTLVRAVNKLRIGSLIDGTRDEIYLCARPLAINADIEGGFTWRESR